MTGIEIAVMLIIGFIIICLFVRYWHFVITALAFGAAYDLYGAHGAAADYTSIFIGWCVAFIICSKLFGLPFGDAVDSDAYFDNDRIVENQRRETTTQVAQHHQREFKKRF